MSNLIQRLEAGETGPEIDLEIMKVLGLVSPGMTERPNGRHVFGVHVSTGEFDTRGYILPFTTSKHPRYFHWEMLLEGWEWGMLLCREDGQTWEVETWNGGEARKDPDGEHPYTKGVHQSLPIAMTIAALKAWEVGE